MAQYLFFDLKINTNIYKENMFPEVGTSEIALGSVI